MRVGGGDVLRLFSFSFVSLCIVLFKVNHRSSSPNPWSSSFHHQLLPLPIFFYILHTFPSFNRFVFVDSSLQTHQFFISSSFNPKCSRFSSARVLYRPLFGFGPMYWLPDLDAGLNRDHHLHDDLVMGRFGCWDDKIACDLFSGDPEALVAYGAFLLRFGSFVIVGLLLQMCSLVISKRSSILSDSWRRWCDGLVYWFICFEPIFVIYRSVFWVCSSLWRATFSVICWVSCPF